MPDVTHPDRDDVRISLGEAAKLVAEELIYKCEYNPWLDDVGDDFCGDYHVGRPDIAETNEENERAYEAFEKRLYGLRRTDGIQD